MNSLIASFSHWNDNQLERVFNQAVDDVTVQGGVDVVSYSTLKDPDPRRVELAVGAAHKSDVTNADCLAILTELTTQQVDNRGLAVSIALTGNATKTDVNNLLAVLGAPPQGASREVRAAKTLPILYEHIVRWLNDAIDRRSTLARTAAEETLDAELPKANDVPAQYGRIRQQPR